MTGNRSGKRRTTHPRNVTTENPTNVSGFVDIIESLHVRSWYRQQDARGRPEQVWLIIKYENRRKPDGVLRLKSESAVEALIAALEAHKQDVWR